MKKRPHRDVVRFVALTALAGCFCYNLMGQTRPYDSMSRLRALLSSEEGVEIDEQPEKCGTPIVFDAKRRLSEFPAPVRSEMSAILQRPFRQKNRLTPSGRFRVHYDTTGTNQPAMLSGGSPVAGTHEEYVDSVAAILDNVWSQEVGRLGFGLPATDNSAGGGPEYDVYLENLPVGTFGYTEPETVVEGGARESYTSFVVMDNDFWGYRTPGLAGLRVTAAHEFHHASQFGAYGVWGSISNPFDLYFYELSATWLEDVLYSEVNDYLFDVPQFFQQYKDGAGVSYSFTEFGVRRGYERAVWGHFLARRFGADIMRLIWEEVKLRQVLRAHDVVLQRFGSSLASAIGEFTVWNFFTADRADTIRYYPEGRRYPRLIPNLTVNHTGTVSTINTSAPALSCQSYQFFIGGDTVTAMVTNTDFEGAYANVSARPAFTIALGGSDPPGADQHLSNGLTIGFKTNNYDLWRTTYLGSLAKADLKTQFQPFPNPIRLNRSDALHLPVDDPTATTADVFVLSAGSLDLALNGRYPVNDFFGIKMVSVSANDLRSKVSSGIHFVVLKTATREYRWKVAIVR